MGEIHKTVLTMDDKSRVKVTKNLAKLKLENERTKTDHMISFRKAFLQKNTDFHDNFKVAYNSLKFLPFVKP